MRNLEKRKPCEKNLALFFNFLIRSTQNLKLKKTIFKPISTPYSFF